MKMQRKEEEKKINSTSKNDFYVIYQNKIPSKIQNR